MNILYQGCIKKSYNRKTNYPIGKMGGISELALHHHVNKKTRKTIFKSSRYSKILTLISWAKCHVISKIDSGFIWRLSIVASDITVVLIVLFLFNLARVDFFVCVLFRLMKPPNKNSNVGKRMLWKFSFLYMLLSSCPKP